MIALNTSHGFETDTSVVRVGVDRYGQLIMRLSVLLSDCLVYIPASVLFVTYCLRQCSETVQRRVPDLRLVTVDSLRPSPLSQSVAD